MASSAPPSAGADDAPDLLALLLHRLGSPFGAITNYVHVLPPDEMGCKDGLGEAIAGARAAMDEARGWIEAARAAAREAPAPIDLTALLASAAGTLERDVQGPQASPKGLRGSPPALRWLLGALLREADAVFPAGDLAVTADTATGLRVQIAPADARGGVPEPTDRVRLADALARRLGGRVEPVEDADGAGALRLSLPSSPEAPPTA